MQWESSRRSDPLVKFDDVWLRVSEVVLVRPEMVGPGGYQREHTKVLLKNGFEFKLDMGVAKFFDIARKAQESLLDTRTPKE